MERLGSFGRTVVLAGSLLAAGCGNIKTNVRSAHAVISGSLGAVTEPLQIDTTGIARLVSQLGGTDNPCAVAIGKVRAARRKMGEDIEGKDPDDADINCSLIASLKAAKDTMDRDCKKDMADGVDSRRGLASVAQIQRGLYQRLLQWGITGYNAANAIEVCKAQETARSSK